ncbi:Myosin-binding protein 1 [Linum grandiflorum]
MGHSKAVSSSRKRLDIRSVLASAVLEWLLILMLLVNAIFSYLISTFAHYCGLQAPCPLCSRLDHILGSRKLKHYYDLVCRNHKLEISSLVLCHAHDTLVDVHGMCETCLFSFATTNKSNAETYRLLVGKLGEDCGFGHDEDGSAGGQSSKARKCSCCNEPFTSRGAGNKLVKLKSTSSEASDADVPLFTPVKSREVDSLAHVEVNAESDAEDKAQGSVQEGVGGLDHESHPFVADDSVEYVPLVVHMSSIPEHSTLDDPLAHVGYTEVNADSDAEYETQGSVQEVGSSGLVHETHPLMSDDSIEPEPTLEPLTDRAGYIGVKVDSDAESEDRMSSEEDDAHVATHEIHPLMADVSVECVSREAFADSTFDLPADVGYAQVNVCSDAESEDQASYDVENADASSLETHPGMDNVALEHIPSKPDVVVVDQVMETSQAVDAHDIEELNWQRAETTEPSASPELIPFYDDPSPSVASVLPVEQATEEEVEEDKFISSSNDREIVVETSSKENDDPSPSVASVLQVEQATEEAEEEGEEDKFISSLNDREIVVETSSKESNSISIDNVASPLDAIETGVEALEESKLISIDNASSAFDTTNCLPLDLTIGNERNEGGCLSSSEEDVETPVEGLKETWDTRKEDIWEPDSEQEAAGETYSETNHVSNENSQHWHNSLDLGDAYKLAVGNKGRHLSEQWLGKDSSRLSEDLRNLASHLSGVREQSLSDAASPRVPMSPRVPPMSPKLSINSDEWTGVQMLQKRMSLERNESGLSLDGSLVGEIEGENLVDRLKRQVDHDKKLLNVLYKELEEERNASAIAANQAMAMITRLQEEKASFQMEAQQCLRVMEDQAEYDMEALQKMNDLLVEKEKEIEDLEAELEFYRNTFHPDVENAADIRVDRAESPEDKTEAKSFKA